MDEKDQKPKLVMPRLHIQEVKKPSGVSSTPATPMSMRKSSSVKHSCLCAPTTHAGSFRCRYHRNPGVARTGLTRNSMSVGSNLADLAKLSELAAKPSRMCDLSAQ